MYILKLQPEFKDYLWGGSSLERLFGKKSGLSITAESWELSSHPDGPSRVVNGKYSGRTLKEVLDENPAWAGGEGLPILIKFIDAASDLSIQVHPSDETAIAEAGEQGKAEMWYIVDAAPGAYLYYGFSSGIDPEKLVEMAENGSVCEVLNRVETHKGDVFYVLPGTVHAIGAGNVIAEIQQNSNTTFRVFDYGRVGADGKKRQLHVKRACEVINYDVFPAAASGSFAAGGHGVRDVFDCSYFSVKKLDCRGSITLCAGENSFDSLLIISGSGKLSLNGESVTVQAGDSLFIPAAAGEYTAEGEFEALISRRA